MISCEYDLLVDGNPVDDPENYVLRIDDWKMPTLYYLGKRVTKSWALQLTIESPEDKHGGNANTA